ncbi:MAG: deoxyribodipyrimidine photo-lyase [Syntrophaceae bacterium]
MNQKRARTLKEGSVEKGPVAYWMSRDQRAGDNWALLWAQELALKNSVPLVVIFCLVPEFLNAAQRQYCFMLKGLREVESALSEKSIPFYLLTGSPEYTVPEWLRAHGIAAMVTDFDPLRIKREWKERVSVSIDIPFFEVDAHNIIPCWILSQKQEYGAYTIRPKIHRALDEYLDEYPELKTHPVPWKKKAPTANWDNIMNMLTVDRSVPEASWIQPGEREAQKALDTFIHNKLSRYDELRNDPTMDGQSHLSPYLHFGHLSPQRVALDVMHADVPENLKDAFLEELIVRRELSDNFCFYNPDYDRFDGFPDWARKTLDKHRKDFRAYIYSQDQLECGQTHDDLWNAAQMEMVMRGKMHGYMRMYWAKKILEWTPSPETALETAIYLNDRYELDGRDPNGYAGIAWSIGGVHDRAWNERNVFGKVRYMSYNGCKSKFNIKIYIERINSLEK